MRARGNGAGGARIILDSAYGSHGIAIAVGGIKDDPSDISPAPDSTRPCAVIYAIGGVGVQQMEDRRRHITREGEAAQLIVHDGDPIELVLGIGNAVTERLHGLHEIVSIANDPRAAENVVPRTPLHSKITGGLGLPVYANGTERLVLIVELTRAVKDIVTRDVHKCDVVVRTSTGKQGRAGRVGGPAGHSTLRGLGLVHGGIGSAVDNGAVGRPVVLVIRLWVGEVERVDIAEVERGEKASLLRKRADGTTQLAVATRHERAPGRHGNNVPQHRVMLVRLGNRRLGKRDRPLDAELRIRKVHEGIGLLELGRPMSIHQVGVGRAILKGLEGVPHATRHINGLGRVERAGIDVAIRRAAGAKVHPRPKDGAASD